MRNCERLDHSGADIYKVAERWRVYSQGQNIEPL